MSKKFNSRGKRIVEMSLSKNALDVMPNSSSTLSGNIPAFASHDTEHCFFDSELQKVLPTTLSIDPNSNLVILTTPTNNNDCDMTQSNNEDAQIDIRSLSVVLETSLATESCHDTVAFSNTGPSTIEFTNDINSVYCANTDSALLGNSLPSTINIIGADQNSNIDVQELQCTTESSDPMPSTSTGMVFTSTVCNVESYEGHNSDSCSTTNSNISLNLISNQQHKNLNEIET
ncbi:unnamed protein product [Parnassius apollo]|uniref:(apollo) hypothetical protein n=1 Tax=Parnassius apollo TaxID=110799 RepID=A0A8S3X614_PARAO|nr:unnamed protein product [Parnassius apollo]